MAKYYDRKPTKEQIEKLTDDLNAKGHDITCEGLYRGLIEWVHVDLSVRGPSQELVAFSSQFLNDVFRFDDGKLQGWRLDPERNDSIIRFWTDRWIADGEAEAVASWQAKYPPLQIITSEDQSTVYKIQIMGVSSWLPPLGGVETVSADFPELEFRLAADYLTTGCRGSRHEWWSTKDKWSSPLRVWEDDAEGRSYEYMAQGKQVARYPDWFILAGDPEFDLTDLPEIQPKTSLPGFAFELAPGLALGKAVS